MAIKTFRPTTSGRRGMTSQDTSMITAKKPVRSLLAVSRGAAGRNSKGRITTRHKGGGAKRFIRTVNFNLPVGTVAVIEAIEYDPNRSARLARIKDQDGKFHYILAANAMKLGQTVKVGDDVAIEAGNRLPLANIPTGAYIYAIELQPNRGAQLVRSAGNSAQLVSKDGEYVQIKMPSGEVRMVRAECMAHIGVLGNDQHQNVKLGKAGRKRHMGIRPTVRGVVMNAVDHPHGGGDGGRHRMARPPVTPWGQKTLGYKTRTRKSTSKFIVKSRHESKRK